jgi:RNA polymerase sigma-70 factor, ECF subfamily
VVNDWDRLVREYGPAVYATAWRILGHAADAEDVVQEAFLQAHQVGQAQEVHCWEALLRRLATCRALDHLRQRRPTVSIGRLAIPTSAGDPEAAAAGRELFDRLRLALAEMSPREAAVFCLLYFDDLSRGQIAETLRISPGAVSAALHKARARLESLLLTARPGRSFRGAPS